MLGIILVPRTCKSWGITLAISYFLGFSCFFFPFPKMDSKQSTIHVAIHEYSLL